MITKNIQIVDIASQATPTISVDSSGLITATATQSAGYVSAGTKSATKQLSTQAAQTITPGTSNKTIASGKYLTGTQTIKGDSNLVAANIVKGKTIFGVDGSYEFKSSIIVTAPTGSTVTCKNGSMTKTATESNGTWTFTNCDIGTWVVTAVSNDTYHTVIESVTIAQSTQMMRYYVTIDAYSLTLIDNTPCYINPDLGNLTYYYSFGSTCSVDTSGGTYKINSTSTNFGACSNNTINITHWKTLQITTTVSYNVNHDFKIGFCNASQLNGEYQLIVGAGENLGNGTFTKTYTADLSQLTGSYYLKIYSAFSSPGTGYSEIRNVKLLA